jgi:6-phosphogluconolactonase
VFHSSGGCYLLAANQDSDSITIFRIDRESGLLEFSGKEIPVPTPVCVKGITCPI